MCAAVSLDSCIFNCEINFAIAKKAMLESVHHVCFKFLNIIHSCCRHLGSLSGGMTLSRALANGVLKGTDFLFQWTETQ